MKYSGFFFVILLFFAGQNLLRAATFGEISVQEISITSNLGSQTGHGYVEYRFRIVNRDTKLHQVGLEISESFGVRGTILKRSANSVEVPPKSTAVLRLLQPPVRMERGNQAKVIIDGRYQQGTLPFNEMLNHFGTSGISHEFANILTSKDVPGDLREMLRSGVPPEKKPEEENEETPQTEERAVVMPGGMTGSPVLPPELVPWTSNVPVEEWSDHWLGYTRFDAVVLTAAEWQEIREQHAGIYNALRKYTESGGMLGIIGSDGNTPKEWVKSEQSSNRYHAVLGFAFVLPKEITAAKPLVEPFRELTLKQAKLWNDAIGGNVIRRLYHGGPPSSEILANDTTLLSVLPVVANYGINVKLIMVLIVVFAVLIGPVNIYVLSLMKRRIWLLWTVPVTSLVASMLVLGVSFFQEGLLRQASSATCTILDQRREEAITFGYVGFYSTLTPRGILFSPETEATACMDRSYSGSKSLELDITAGGNQFLTRGWISARVPSYFAIRKAQSQRKERLTFDWTTDSPSVTNGFGADIKSLWVRSPQGKRFIADGVKAGQKVALISAEDDSSPSPASAMQALQSDIYSNTILTGKISGISNLIPSGSYFAEIDRWNPFVEQGIDRTMPYQNKTTIFGIFE